MRSSAGCLRQLLRTWAMFKSRFGISHAASWTRCTTSRLKSRQVCVSGSATSPSQLRARTYLVGVTRSRHQLT